MPPRPADAPCAGPSSRIRGLVTQRAERRAPCVRIDGTERRKIDASESDAAVWGPRLLTTPAEVRPRPRVVIVGAGFAGMWAAQALARAPVEITVIDRRNYHLFQPLLYQVATAALSPGDIAWPIRRMLRRQRNTRVLLGEVTGVDVAAPRRVPRGAVHPLRLSDPRDRRAPRLLRTR